MTTDYAKITVIIGQCSSYSRKYSHMFFWDTVYSLFNTLFRFQLGLKIEADAIA